MKPIQTVGIVGSGTMGRGIAHVALASVGLYVTLLDSQPQALASAQAQLAIEYDRLETQGTISSEERTRREGALSLATSYDELSGCDLIIEAVPEVPEIKFSVLREVAAVAGPAAIIASNTSSMSITHLSSAVTNPQAFFGVHFFNPVPRMQLVEVVRTPLSDKRLEEPIVTFILERLQKTPIVVEDRPGFVVNALLVPFLLAAARMLDTGYATAEQIDEGLRLGAGHRMGPLALSDLIGLDVLRDIGEAIHKETRDPAVVIPNNLRRLVDAGRLGRKSGAGFFTYA
ncbi:3-hydroxyacyl-CoA dehydrogenase family protein [Arthrobacter sp. NPDC089319]|uniref:3-hydroxyacyl-CoA dehydrogenase family protein n=1 Tax=Arthrobacter sp. NPDC089319 TaxID=3155915 RepID=UPI00343F85A5